MSDIISDREEFIELHNRNRIYSFHELSDEIIREFFPLLPVEEYLCQGKLSNEIISEFKELINMSIGENAIHKIQIVRCVLEKYFDNFFPDFGFKVDGGIHHISFHTTTSNGIDLQIGVIPQIYVRSHLIEYIKESELFEKKLIGAINKSLVEM